MEKESGQTEKTRTAAEHRHRHSHWRTAAGPISHPSHLCLCLAHMHRIGRPMAPRALPSSARSTRQQSVPARAQPLKPEHCVRFGVVPQPPSRKHWRAATGGRALAGVQLPWPCRQPSAEHMLVILSTALESVYSTALESGCVASTWAVSSDLQVFPGWPPSRNGPSAHWAGVGWGGPGRRGNAHKFSS